MKEKEDVCGSSATDLGPGDVLFSTDTKVRSINWWSSREHRELTRHEGLRPAKPLNT